MSPAETVQRFIDRINAGDVEGLSVLMTTDHRFIDSLGSVIVGRETMREGWRQYFQMVPDYHMKSLALSRMAPRLHFSVLLGERTGVMGKCGRRMLGGRRHGTRSYGTTS